MPRPLRLEFEGAVYHVIARGNERRAIFLDDADREIYLERLAVCRARFGFFLYAFCLMDNHVHLALERGPVPLSRVMLNLQSYYGQRFNRRHDRVGHLFQGRYKAFLVEKERYLLALLRYIHSNPLKACLVARPQDYRWSSDRYFRAGEGPAWLDLDRVLGMLGTVRSEALASDRQPTSDDSDTPYEDVAALASTIKGDDGFAERALSEAGATPLPAPAWTIEAIATAVASVEGLSVDDLRRRGQAARPSRARSIAAYFARWEARIPVSRMARFFKRDESTLIRAVRKLEATLDSDERLRARLSAITKRLPPRSAGVHG